MLRKLSVENLAIIDRAHLALGDGFSALTGETGAGKSLLIDAVELALGGRADADLVRVGAARATVTLEVDVSSRDDLAARAVALGIPVEHGKLLIQREIIAEGRSIAKVNGRTIPISALKQLGAELVDLHGQHDHQSLLDPARHLDFLDSWIGEPAATAKAAVATEFETVSGLRRKLSALRQGRRSLEQRIDLLRYQIDEIDAVSPLPGETGEIQARLERLKHVERLTQAASLALTNLTDDESGVEDRLGSSVRNLDEVTRYDSDLEPIVAMLRTAAIEVQEAAHLLRSYADLLESDPRLLEDTAVRLDALQTLFRKYGDDEAAVLTFAAQAREELEDLTIGVDDEEGLVVALDLHEAALVDFCRELSLLRKERAVVFAEVVQEGLKELAMERAVFEVAFSAVPADANGADRIEFFFSANAGEPPRQLARIASGGELSRVMLAIKSVFAKKAGVPTLIFDEVDAGLGGRAAAAVARRLEILAENYQVLVISHLPQIASRAEHHFRIEKVESGGRVTTEVRPLSSDERESEIARMLAGEEVTGAALANARAMLAERSVYR
jgi:DNA repair protein RecN (Recombination protein N)